MTAGEALGVVLFVAVMFAMGIAIGFPMGEHAGRDRAWDELKAAIVASGGQHGGP